MDMNNEPVVFLVGSGQQVYREYLVRGLAERSAVWLIGESEATWQAPYIAGSTACPMLDSSRMVPDEAGIIDAALKVTTDRDIAGVVTWDEAYVIAAARLAETLGVRGLGATAARNCRDKQRSREIITAAGLAQPRVCVVRTLGEAARAASWLGYPVVLKPRGMGASMGVVKVTEPEELPAAFAVTNRARYTGPTEFEDGILVEELVTGPEISVDAVSAGGEYRPFCVARKQLGHPPSFEEVGHLVDAADPLTGEQELLRVLMAAHAALGIADGVTHTELRLSARGPVIIEVNGRLGGDLIPYLGLLATGVDPGRVAADVALGARPDLEPSRARCAGIRFLYPPADCRVLDVSLQAAQAVPGVLDARAMAAPGDRLALPPRAHLGRYAHVMAVAATADACEKTLDRACSLARLRYEEINELP